MPILQACINFMHFVHGGGFADCGGLYAFTE